MEYVLIPKTTLDSYKISEEHTLTPEEISTLVVDSKIIKKFIEQKAISIQFDIWAWAWTWKETLWLELVKYLAEIAREIWDIKNTFDKYLQKDKEIYQEN